MFVSPGSPDPCKRPCLTQNPGRPDIARAWVQAPQATPVSWPPCKIIDEGLKQLAVWPARGARFAAVGRSDCLKKLMCLVDVLDWSVHIC